MRGEEAGGKGGDDLLLRGARAHFLKLLPKIDSVTAMYPQLKNKVNTVDLMMKKERDI